MLVLLSWLCGLFLQVPTISNYRVLTVIKCTLLNQINDGMHILPISYLPSNTCGEVGFKTPLNRSVSNGTKLFELIYQWILGVLQLQLCRPIISPDFSGDLRFLKYSLNPLFLIAKQHGSQWDAVLHSVSWGSKLFANIIKVFSVACISAKIFGFVMVKLWSPWLCNKLWP